MHCTTISCQEIVVKFSGDHVGQLIRYTDHTSRVHGLVVIDSGARLEVAYVDKDKCPIKIIAFPMSQVREYACESIQTVERS